LEHKVWPPCSKLHLATQTRRADDGTRGEIIETLTTRTAPRIARIGPLADHGKDKARRQDRRDVLHGMNGDVGATLQESVLDLLDKETLPTDLSERDVEDLVALGNDANKFDLEVRMRRLKHRGYPVGLPEGELTFARRDAKKRGLRSQGTR